jgi:predicted O-methyltransferase YrrM
MANSTDRQKAASQSLLSELGQKVLREALRPFRPRRQRQRASAPIHVPSRHVLADFNPQSCTVEPEGLDLLTELVRQSAQYDGPIVEIGTLLGITATHMALAKAARQKIITVDNYCWNPWNLPSDAHHALAHQTLYYLIETGHVEQLRMDKAHFYATYALPAPSLVFLDAWHTYEETKKDIEWACAAGARLIAGHDYSTQFPDVMQVVNEFGGTCKLAGSVWLLHPQTAAAARAA